MRICRFVGDAGDDRLGVVQGSEIVDVTPALEAIPAQRWPLAQGDPLITHLAAVTTRIRELLAAAPRRPLAGAKLRSPVANPSKIVNAPINYTAHIDEAKKDQSIAHGREIKNIWDWGLFLKANSALVGPGEEIRLRMPERRNDHEVELAVIIGRPCNKVAEQDALAYVAGYAIGLDMTIRGPELPSFRKSVDTYAVCGPWITTADEVGDPGNLRLSISVNGEVRQDATTARMVYGVAKLIEYASSMYTLLPGDLIFTGTPEGVGPVKPGDVLHAEIEKVGAFDILVAAEYA
jgi:2-keto-4-pentenoate hydratase/2-oxohepta-3-ene-1,7-dioic acid hydratase in catechol pathway